MICKFENAKFEFLGVVAYIKIIAVVFIFNPYGNRKNEKHHKLHLFAFKDAMENNSLFEIISIG